MIPYYDNLKKIQGKLTLSIHTFQRNNRTNQEHSLSDSYKLTDEFFLYSLNTEKSKST